MDTMTRCQILSLFFSSDRVEKKAIRRMTGGAIFKTGKVAGTRLPDAADPALAYILDGTTKAADNTA